MRTFIDTSAFFALLDRADANHKKASAAWARYLILSTHWLPAITSGRTFALLQSRLGLSAVRGFQEDILPLLNIEFVTAGTHRTGIAALLAAARRNLSFVDCVSFEVMRSQGIRSAFAFDPHFKEQGFIVIP